MRLDEDKWESRICPVGSHCWCRMIFTVRGKEVLHEGAIDRELAEYIVSLHNRHLTSHSSGQAEACSHREVLSVAHGYCCKQCGLYIEPAA